MTNINIANMFTDTIFGIGGSLIVYDVFQSLMGVGIFLVLFGLLIVALSK